VVNIGVVLSAVSLRRCAVREAIMWPKNRMWLWLLLAASLLVAAGSLQQSLSPDDWADWASVMLTALWALLLCVGLVRYRWWALALGGGSAGPLRSASGLHDNDCLPSGSQTMPLIRRAMMPLPSRPSPSVP
jgi:hypothetical protein